MGPCPFYSMYRSINEGGNEGSGVIQDLGTGVVHYLGTGPKAFISVVQCLGKDPGVFLVVLNIPLLR